MSIHRGIVPLLPLLLVCGVTLAPEVCPADTVALQTGGFMRGRVVDSVLISQRPSSPNEKKVTSKTVTISTLTGGRLILESSQVRFVTRRPLIVEEFEVRSRHTPDELDPLWSLADWCRSKGLKPQRDETLRRVLRIDPDNVQAHQGLGQVRYDGRWKTPDEEMRSRGFVKFEGRYVTPQEIEILKTTQSRRKIDREWTDKVRSWTFAYFGDEPEKRRRARTQLLKISDPRAIPALNRILRASENEASRQLYLRILTHIPGPEPIPLLVDESLYDASQAIRVMAQELIAPSHRDIACPIYARALHNSDNDVVRRAARMLEQVADDRFVPDLIDALITTHEVATQVIDNSNAYSFGSKGTFGNPDTVTLPPDIAAKLLTGQYPNGVIVLPNESTQYRVKTVMVNREFRNAEALSALQALTKQSFAYDKDQWRRWWAARTTTGIARTSTAP